MDDHQPDRAAAAWAQCLPQMFDELDLGLLLLDGGGQVLLVNRCARNELDARHALTIDDGRARGRGPADEAALAAALRGATLHRQREMLALGDGDQRVGVAVVPLPGAADGSGRATMLVLGRRPVCDAPAVHGFAQAHGLTPAETRVLEALCAGVPPRQFAQSKGVRISTVRTQIGCVRDKTGARSIRALMRMVAVLPPMMPPLGSQMGSQMGSPAPRRPAVPPARRQ